MGSSGRGNPGHSGGTVPAAFKNSPAYHSFPFGAGSGIKGDAIPYSKGGGKRFTLSSQTPFSGREAGGGTRDEIYGSRTYGSGYPYGVTGNYIGGRPFPFIFYPIAISPYNNYYGANEIYVLNDTQRIGGALSSVIIQPTNASISITANTYRLIGDNSSVTAVYNAILASSPPCGITNSSITPFKTTVNTTAPTPEQVVQYYRASSFALSLDTYNNNGSSLANMPTNSTSTSALLSDTPLPTDIDSAFLSCLNATIGESAPLVNPPHGLSGRTIAGAVVGSVVGFAVLLLLYRICCAGGSERKEEFKMRDRTRQWP
ncbi:hypothetical protein BD410DRAFT_724799 [Rickenella mellea]|uniref:Uncharacterized protein n=1 Tax=Rickenella mellea TaxID=50990 RepID=A0A4Y7Q173_9AGAM|nr:hypothetical protein BD410DRAFT_724799 [Rickenella mellea]